MRRAVWAIGIFATLGCGPSFQALYEGDARFEHCYALEDSGSGTMQKRADCWRDWIDHYTFGQTRDRVQYASNRYRALTNAALPTDEGMMSAAPGAGQEGTTGAPAPTNAFAPPPTTASAQQSGAPPKSTWMLTAPQQVLPDPARDAGPPALQADAGPSGTFPATATSAINPTILPPPPPPPMKTTRKKAKQTL